MLDQMLKRQLRPILTLKHRPQGKAPLRVCGRKQKEHCVFILHLISQSSIVKLEWKARQLTGDSPNTLLSFTPSLQTLIPAVPFIHSVCLILSVVSGRVVMSSNHILQSVQLLLVTKSSGLFNSCSCERAWLLTRSRFVCDEFVLPKEEYIL